MRMTRGFQVILGVFVLMAVVGCQAKENLDSHTFDLVKYEGNHKPRKERLRSKILDGDKDTRAHSALGQLQAAETKNAGR